MVTIALTAIYGAAFVALTFAACLITDRIPCRETSLLRHVIDRIGLTPHQ